MARNGSGTYALPTGNPVASGTVISSTTNNTTQSDIATALTNSVCRNGEAPFTSDQPMGDNKITGLKNPTAQTDATNLLAIQHGTGVYGATVGGSGNAITVTLSPAITAYAAGQKFTFIASAANTGGVTVNFSGLGAKAITKLGTTALVANDILSNSLIEVEYDGTRFQLISPIGTGAIGDALTSNPLSQFAATTSAQLAGVISNETGSGLLVFGTSPTLITPALGTPSALVGTNISGTASSFTASNVTTNANLTGHVTSVGNAAVLGSFTSAQLKTALTNETGSGAACFAESPTLVTPALGTPASGVATNLSGTAASLTAGTVTTNANLTGHITSSGNAAVLGSFTSAQLKAALTNETGSGAACFAESPTLVTPALGTPASGVATNLTGTASGLTSGNVTTNANLTGHITSTGNAAVLGSFTSAQLATALTNETGSGAACFATAPTIVGLTATGDITMSGKAVNGAVHTEAAHASTSDIWSGGNTCLLSGSVVTFIDIADAPQAGAVRYVVANAAHVITNNSALAVDGSENYTCAVNDVLMFTAKTTSTFRVNIIAHGDSASGGGGSGGESGLLANSATVASNYSLASGSNAVSAGPMTVATGVTVTIPTGSRWAIV